MAFLLCALIVGSGSLWATDITYTFTSKSWAANDGSGSANWTNVSDGNGFTSGQGIQVTTGTTGANATSPVSFVNITKIVVTYNTNASKGAGSIEIKIGTNESTSNSVGYSGSGDGTSANFTTQFNYATPQSGTVKLTTNTTANSIYVKSIKITYATEPFTVTYGDTGGTVTEASAGAGVTLASRSNVGSYTFAGWSATNVSTETTTAPTIISAGVYKPAANLTLYPVYTRTEGSGSPTAFSVGDTGEFAIVSAKQGDEKYYALPTSPTVSSGKITAQEITVSEKDGVKFVTPANADGFEWTIAEATNGYTLSDGSNYIYHSNGGASGTNLAYGDGTSYTWSFTAVGNYIKMAAMNGSTVNSRGLLFSGTTIGGYALSNWGASGYYETMILPIVAASTTYYTSLLVSVSTNTGRNYGTMVTPAGKSLNFKAVESNVKAYISPGLNAGKTAISIQNVSIVPENTPIIIKTTTQGVTVNVPVTFEDADIIASINKLVAGDGTTTWNGTSGYTYFYVANNEFHRATSGTLASGKAYLKILTSELDGHELSFGFEDDENKDVTGISDVKNNISDVRGNIFNLAGQRVNANHKGIVIVNGKKFLNK